MLNRALIEGVELNVCAGCSKFGKVIAPIKKQIYKEPIKKAVPEEEKIELLIDNYADVIKKKRESLGLTQKDFANKLNEKESIIHKIEVGAFVPTLSLARKLEKLLEVKLIEEYKKEHEPLKRKREEGFTLGDFIKLKK